MQRMDFKRHKKRRTTQELSRSDVVQVVRKQLVALDEIVFAYLFGSVIESEQWNDVDIGIYVSDKRIVDDSYSYQIRLSLTLEKVLGMPVDVVLLNTAPDHLVHHVSKGELVVDRDSDARADFLSAAWKRYFEIRLKRKDFVAQLASL